MPLASPIVSTTEGAAPEPEQSSAAEPTTSDATDRNGHVVIDPDELKSAFLRLAPQGSAQWNFATAFSQLEEHYLDQLSGPETAAGLVLPQPPPPPTPEEEVPRGKRDLIDKVVGRYLMPRLQTWVDRRANLAVQRSGFPEVEAQLAKADQALETTVEALRFLAAPLRRLENADLTTASPIDGLPWLINPVDFSGLIGTVTETLTANRPRAGAREAEVLVGECGSGALVNALTMAGVAATGIEPRGTIALGAIESGLSVHIGEVSDYLQRSAPASLDSIVLAGVVDRLSLARNIELLSLATDRLRAGALLVVVGHQPEAVAREWGVVALDLFPGRPLHSDTWLLLMARHGLIDGALLGSGAESGDMFAVVGTKPEDSS
jgi:Methionine biosynthesis protein MetW